MSFKALAHSMGRVPVYFFFVVLTLILINTPLPRIAISALISPSVGQQIADTLIGYSRDLFLLLLISIYFEWAKGKDQEKTLTTIVAEVGEARRTYDGLSADQVRSLVLSSMSAEDLAAVALDRGLGQAASPRGLVRMIAPSKPCYFDVSLALNLRRSTEDSVAIRVEMSLSTNLSEILIVATRRTSDTATIASRCEHVFDVLTLAPQADLTFPVAAIESTLQIYSRVGGNLTKVEFALVSVDEKRRILGDFQSIDLSEVAVLRGNCAHVQEDEKMFLDLTYTFNLNFVDHYCYWLSDRPMFVRQLEVDARGLEGCPSIDVQPFLGVLKDRAMRKREHKQYVITVNDWVLQGHGLAVVW